MVVSALDREVVELSGWELVAEFLDSKLGVGVLPDDFDYGGKIFP